MTNAHQIYPLVLHIPQKEGFNCIHFLHLPKQCKRISIPDYVKLRSNNFKMA